MCPFFCGRSRVGSGENKLGPGGIKETQEETEVIQCRLYSKKQEPESSQYQMPFGNASGRVGCIDFSGNHALENTPNLKEGYQKKREIGQALAMKGELQASPVKVHETLGDCVVVLFILHPLWCHFES